MDPRLFDVLATVARRMEATEAFEVISGYRAPETNAATGQADRAGCRASRCTCPAWRRIAGCRAAIAWAWRGWRRRCRWAGSGCTGAMASSTWTAARRGAGSAAGRPGGRLSPSPFPRAFPLGMFDAGQSAPTLARPRRPAAGASCQGKEDPMQIAPFCSAYVQPVSGVRLGG